MKKIVQNTKTVCKTTVLVITSIIFCAVLTSCDKDEHGDKPTQFTVSFISNGGTAVKSQKVNKFERVVKPEDPKREGYLFVAWYMDNALTNEWDFSFYEVTKDLTFYAAWQLPDPLFKISGLKMDNYPRVDGSTSTSPLNMMVACKLLDIGYRWKRSPFQNTQSLEPNLTNNSEKILEQVKTSQTHESFINLINNDTDLILSARKVSRDEKEYADAKGVDLIETPIALDAFVFTLHPSNPIKSLTIKQIQDIYTGKITNWKELGGIDAKITPYLRNANSGSQELFEMMVMKDLNIMEFPESFLELVINSMIGVFDVVTSDQNSICYTFHYYKEQMITETNVITAAIDEIHPNKESIKDKSYPLVVEVYAIIRSNLDKSSMAYKLYELLQTENGKRVISESGYIPN
jgi:phosphate transport system substrate-binding protein